MSSKDDLLFAQTALRKKLCTDEQARECLDASAKSEVIGENKTIFEIFFDRGYLTLEQVNYLIGKPAATPLERGSSAPARVSPPPARTGSREADKGDSTIRALGDFEITGKLGEGGMGVVYKAKQKSLDRDVALKILPPRLAADSEFVERFHREAKSAARLNHQNIIQVYAAGEERGYHYMAIELINGATTLDMLERKGKFPEHAAIKLMLEMSLALEQAHKSGIVHRDLKPDNIMMSMDGVSKLADLGLAKESVNADITQAGAIVGTPRYLSPEQAAGADSVDGRADLYSLGASIYHLVSGDGPFDGDNAMQVIVKHLNDPAPPLKSRAPNLSDGFCAIVDKLLLKKPEERFQSAKELAQALDDLNNRRPVPPQKVPVAPAMQKPPSPTNELEFSLMQPSGAPETAIKSTPPIIPEQAAKTTAMDFGAMNLMTSTPGSSATATPQMTNPPPSLQGGFGSTGIHSTGTMSRKPYDIDEGYSTKKMLLHLTLAVAVAGAAYYFLVSRGGGSVAEEVTLTPEQTVAQADVEGDRLRALFRRVDSDSGRYKDNIANLEQVEVTKLHDDDRRRLSDKIEQLKAQRKSKAEEEFTKLEKDVQTLLAENKYMDAYAKGDSFPDQTLTPDVEEKITELKAGIKSKAQAEMQTSLARIKEEMAKGNFAQVIKLKQRLSLKTFAGLAPAETEQLSDTISSATATIRKVTKADGEIRSVADQVYHLFAEQRPFDAITAAEAALGDDTWRESIKNIEGSKRFVFELEAIVNLYNLMRTYLEANEGQEIVFRNQKATLNSIDFDKRDIDIVYIGRRYNRKFHEFFNRALDIVTLAKMVVQDEDPEFDHRAGIFFLIYGEPKYAAEYLKKAGAEILGIYQQEIDYHQRLKSFDDRMVRVDATDEFRMGIDASDWAEQLEELRKQPGGDSINSDWFQRETPRRKVKLSTYFIGKYEVTNSEYEEFLAGATDANARPFAHETEPEDNSYVPSTWEDKNVGRRNGTLPVVGVDWFDAYAFTKWKNSTDEFINYRLPTEAEWECAASWGPDYEEGEKRVYPWKSSNYSERYAHFKPLKESKSEDTEYARPVTSYRPYASKYGCQNMAGNVREWVHDLFHNDYVPELEEVNPKGPTKGEHRIVRGGSFRTSHFQGRTTARFALPPNTSQIDLGFRLAADPPDHIAVRLMRYGLKRQ